MGGGTPRTAATMFGVQVSFLRLFRGDPGSLPIWSERSAAFRFVQVCSDLFRVVQGRSSLKCEAAEGAGMQRRSRATGGLALRPIRHPCPQSAIPAPPNRPSCTGRNPPLPNTPSRPPPSPIHPSPLPGGRLGGGWNAASGATTFGVQVSFFRLFRGDPGDLPIWSERSAAFRFVQVCSDLFRVVQGVIGVDGRAGGAGQVGAWGGGHGSHFRSSRLW